MTTPFAKSEPDLGALVVRTDRVTADYLDVGADGEVLTADSGQPLGVGWRSVPASGATVGVAVIDFGAFPGSMSGSVTVTGLAAFLAATSVANAWVHAIDSPDNDWRDHRDAVLAGLVVVASDFVDADGFTVYGYSPVLIVGQINVAWSFQ